jgi:hypothetical protein
MIQDKTIDEALIEIMRTKKALEALRAKRKTVGQEEDSVRRSNWQWRIDRHCTREHAAAKRASMDLTRKLADLRAGR